MSFVRDDAAKALRRYQELFVGLALILVSIWVWVNFLGVLRWIALPLAVLGLVSAWYAWRRVRVKAGNDGPGVLEVDERRLSYFGPFGGTSISLDDVIRIEIETTELGPFTEDMFWLFHTRTETARIPSSAQGGDKIFDVLSSFSGADYDAAIRASSSSKRDNFLIWQKRG